MPVTETWGCVQMVPSVLSFNMLVIQTRPRWTHIKVWSTVCWKLKWINDHTDSTMHIMLNKYVCSTHVNDVKIAVDVTIAIFMFFCKCNAILVILLLKQHSYYTIPSILTTPLRLKTKAYRTLLPTKIGT